MMGLSIYLSLALVGWGLARWSLRMARFESSSRGPWCVVCKYSLHGLGGLESTKRCPECGADLVVRTPRFYPDDVRLRRWPALVLWTFGVGMVAFATERAVMLKYEPAGRHMMFGSAETAPLQLWDFRFDGIEHKRYWFFGVGDDFDREALAAIRWVSYDSYTLFLRNYSGGSGMSECAELNRATEVLSFTGADGQLVQIEGGLSQAAFERWAEACNIDVSKATNRAVIGDIVSLLRMYILREEPCDPERQVARLGLHRPVGSAGAYTPWWLLIPFILVVIVYWSRGAGRLWRVV